MNIELYWLCSNQLFNTAISEKIVIYKKILWLWQRILNICIVTNTFVLCSRNKMPAKNMFVLRQSQTLYAYVVYLGFFFILGYFCTFSSSISSYTIRLFENLFTHRRNGCRLIASIWVVYRLIVSYSTSFLYFYTTIIFI